MWEYSTIGTQMLYKILKQLCEVKGVAKDL